MRGAYIAVTASAVFFVCAVAGMLYGIAQVRVLWGSTVLQHTGGALPGQTTALWWHG